MKMVLRLAWLAAGLSLFAPGCSSPAPVIQGTVVEADLGAGRLVVRDEAQAGAQPLRLDVGAAEIGRAPAVGDRVRVVYRVTNTVNRAIAVMNLTQQRGSSPSSRD